MNMPSYKETLINLQTPIHNNLNNTQFKKDISNEEGFSFKDIINSEIQKVNNKQIEADRMTQAFISGEVEDLHKVLIATEEARLSLELAVQVRNKCIEAFKEINNMQL